MPLLLFADNFLAGSLLTILMPTLLLIVIAISFVALVKRVPHDTPGASSTLPPPDVLAAAGEGVDEITPAGPPPGEIK